MLKCRRLHLRGFIFRSSIPLRRVQAYNGIRDRVTIDKTWLNFGVRLRMQPQNFSVMAHREIA